MALPKSSAANSKNTVGHANILDLLKDLQKSGKSGSVVVTLRIPTESLVKLPAETEKLAKEVIQRAQKVVGLQAERVKIFPRFGRFVVKAKLDLLKELIAQPEVAESSPNELSQSMSIPPVSEHAL